MYSFVKGYSGETSNSREVKVEVASELVTQLFICNFPTFKVVSGNTPSDS